MNSTNRNSKLILICALVLAFVCYFTVLALLVPEIGTTFLITSLFSLIAVVMQTGSIILIAGKSNIKGYFYNMPSIYIGVIYIIIQFVAGFVLSMKDPSMKAVLIIEILILAICGTVELYMLYAGLNSKELNEEVTKSISDMRKLSGEAKAIVDIAPDYEWRRLAKAVADEIQYANPVTGENTIYLEREIHCELENLRTAVTGQNREAFNASADKIRHMLSDRNV